MVENMSMPKTLDISKKLKDIQMASNYQSKEMGMDNKVKKISRFHNNRFYYASRKARQFQNKKMAEKLGGGRDVITHTAKERFSKPYPLTANPVFGSNLIYARNRKANIIKGLKVIREKYMDGKIDGYDPFSRRRCKPTLVTSKRGTAMKLAMRQKEIEMQKKIEEENRRKEALERQKAAIKDQDMFKVHDFKIDADLGMPHIELPTQSLRVFSTKPQAHISSRQQRNLSFEKYKRKRGII